MNGYEVMRESYKKALAQEKEKGNTAAILDRISAEQAERYYYEH